MSSNVLATIINETPIPVSNVTNKFREAFEVYDLEKWAQVLGAGDIIQLDGNCVSASYLVISKDPLTAGTVSSVETLSTFTVPFEMGVGAHLSQRTVGQEFAIECVSVEPATTMNVQLEIASISQTTTTLSVTTVLPHGLKPGMRIGIKDCPDSRFNYNGLVVATAPSSTSFTVGFSVAGALPSVTAGPLAGGFVFRRSALGNAPNGSSMIFENASATTASFYVRSEYGEALPSGTVAGAHATTVGTSASVQAINAALAYAFQPTTEYRLSVLVDGLQWTDAAVDTVGQTTNRVKRTQVVPDTTDTYKFRVRAVNGPSLTVPVAKIVSVAKAGTTTATVVTDLPHGLSVNDFVACVGVRDNVAFPNLTTPAQVASIVSPTSFTVVWGTAVTANSNGGSVARANGGTGLQGALAQTIQTVSRIADVVFITGSANFSGLVIGDYVNVHGCRNIVDGASVLVDGVYRVRDLFTTSIALEPIGPSMITGGPDIGSVNCGGTIIKRTDIRISFARILDFERLRVEMLARPGGDLSMAAPVVVQGGNISASAALAAGTQLVGDFGNQLRPTGGSAILLARLLSSAATVNATLVKNTAGKLAVITGYNASTSMRFLKFYNKATAPTVGTDVPILTIPLAPSKDFWIDWSTLGITFSAGIGYAITGAVADNDTTACALADILGLNVYYV